MNVRVSRSRSRHRTSGQRSSRMSMSMARAMLVAALWSLSRSYPQPVHFRLRPCAFADIFAPATGLGRADWGGRDFYDRNVRVRPTRTASRKNHKGQPVEKRSRTRQMLSEPGRTWVVWHALVCMKGELWKCSRRVEGRWCCWRRKMEDERLRIKDARSPLQGLYAIVLFVSKDASCNNKMHGFF